MYQCMVFGKANELVEKSSLHVNGRVDIYKNYSHQIACPAML